MNMVISLLRSLLFSTVLSFVVPIFAVGGVFATLCTVSYVPGIASVGQIGASSIVGFLSVFGSGYPIQGILIIGGTFAVAGSLFDLFNFYVNQGSRGH
ncbi:hypothetical protein C7H19_07470 [Aphanothece hegewaldii CCALA 016]|uniref:Uncharacterized protein n=1 Tax=Aphanothece hegewaldii CCALA 016 TaxID=2107694 RepID=A0A2T1LZP0_9CHRO|nr:hypothetical protein [Aphanothece hegewaldii]PSF37815.1 hypothetical protein C7H19_07470 [Aphanothece hegewaldii CCALA 016]